MIDCPVLILTAVALLAGAAGAAETTLYAATDGNDQWSGRLAQPNAARTDGPVASLGGARNAVRRWRRSGGVGSVTVQFAAGVYPTLETVTFGPEDGGTEGAPVSYRAAPGAKVVFSGGRRIGGWRQGHGPVWVADVPELKDGRWLPNQLWVNGRRATRARTPNEGYLRMTGPLPGIDPHQQRGDAKACLGFSYRPGDLNPTDDLTDAMVVLYHSWTNSQHWVQLLDEQNHTLHFQNRCGWPVGYWERQQRYHVENVRSALDQPGEWVLDRKAGQVLYIPRPGEDLATAEAVLPVVANHLVRLAGEADAGLPVSHLVFRDLAFRHVDWQFPRGTTLDGQAATFLGATIEARGAHACRFEGLEVAHAGGYGVWLDVGCKDNLVQRCHIWDLGGGGVRIGDGQTRQGAALAERNTVDNCFLHHLTEVFNGACGILVQRSSHNTISHNEISDLYYTGISVGWSWGYQESSAHHNVVEHNHVHHLGWGVMSDMGGFYTLGISPGTRIAHNSFHDVLSYSYGGWAMYTDEGSSNIVIENNLAYNTKTGGFHQHYGRENIVRNNILAFASEGQVQRSRQEPHTSFTFEQNIVYFDQGQTLSGNWTDGHYQMRRNLYWAVGGEPEFAGLDWAEWQAKGQDQDSQVADPRFVDAAARDFRLRPDSPALQLGFKPIDPAGIGLYGDAAWVALPRGLQRAVMVFPTGYGQPTPVSDDFEGSAVGAPPPNASVSVGGDHAAIAVTDETAASGRHSLKVVDAPGLKNVWDPHFAYQPHFVKGVATVSFALRVEAGAKLYHEWRTAGHPYLTGPSLHVEPDGRLLAGGKELLKLPVAEWVRLRITCPLGARSTGRYSVEVTLPHEPTRRFEGLACNQRFRALHWLGWVSEATDRRVFYLDDITATCDSPKQK